MINLPIWKEFASVSTDEWIKNIGKLTKTVVRLEICGRWWWQKKTALVNLSSMNMHILNLYLFPCRILFPCLSLSLSLFVIAKSIKTRFHSRTTLCSSSNVQQASLPSHSSPSIEICTKTFIDACLIIWHDAKTVLVPFAISLSRLPTIESLFKQF